ncbi:MAG: ribulose-phosphate 3-epimerase [Candidatus Schekmanbacteria bacterium]|nr:ribulose-phosphate 3-epimerase [Candidatus Schekmanbacteria bacterium]
MDKKIKISASIMCANWMRLEEDIRILEEEKVDYIHYDIMDGFFAPDYCLGTNIINVIRQNTSIPADYHLMVEEPSRILNNFTPEKDALLSIHYEACRNLHRDIMRIKQMGFKPGLILNPATPINAIEYVIEEVDTVTIMTVNPGYKGQKLVPKTLKKLETLNEWRSKNKFSFEICVDGNVNRENIPYMVAYGGDILVAGSSGLFIKDTPLKDSISRLRNYITEGLVL